MAGTDDMEALYSPDAIQSGTTSPGVPRPGLAWDARLRGLVTALATRVPGTAGHCRRVAAQSRLVAGRLGLDPPAVARVECAARIHDVGKIIVSPKILDKPGPLTSAEYAEIQRHVVFGARLVASLEVPEITAIVRHHHERLAGSGYPDGLRGTEIPLGARIVAVVDSYDALASPRPYREVLTPPEALEVLQEEAGHTLDPEVVAAFAA
ncbi:MAG: HD-GYP domain-containing protein [Actinobacteria bacterium]|nr:HD-GYP domain-containing protein [Actinomycetota bacterium]